MRRNRAGLRAGAGPQHPYRPSLAVLRLRGTDLRHRSGHFRKRLGGRKRTAGMGENGSGGPGWIRALDRLLERAGGNRQGARVVAAQYPAAGQCSHRGRPRSDSGSTYPPLGAADMDAKPGSSCSTPLGRVALQTAGCLRDRHPAGRLRAMDTGSIRGRISPSQITKSALRLQNRIRVSSLVTVRPSMEYVSLATSSWPGLMLKSRLTLPTSRCSVPSAG